MVNKNLSQALCRGLVDPAKQGTGWHCTLLGTGKGEKIGTGWVSACPEGEKRGSPKTWLPEHMRKQRGLGL